MRQRKKLTKEERATLGPNAGLGHVMVRRFRNSTHKSVKAYNRRTEKAVPNEQH